MKCAVPVPSHAKRSLTAPVLRARCRLKQRTVSSLLRLLPSVRAAWLAALRAHFSTAPTAPSARLVALTAAVCALLPVAMAAACTDDTGPRHAGSRGAGGVDEDGSDDDDGGEDESDDDDDDDCGHGRQLDTLHVVARLPAAERAEVKKLLNATVGDTVEAMKAGDAERRTPPLPSTVAG
jgi:hypothetical protein